MASGGSRAKSGPTKTPGSRTSERAGYTLTALPFEGYTKRAPGLTHYIPKPSARHTAVWAELWSTPQACAWSLEKWRWPQVAMLCRLRVRAEDVDASAAIFSEMGKLETKLGLSEEGLRYLGWAVAKNELAAKAAEKQPTEAPAEGDEVGQRRQKRLR